MAEKKTAVNFEKAIKDLEKIVEDLESGELSLEQSLKTFEKGIKLTRQCQGELEKAELKVKKLVEENGELKTKPLTNG
ncbi:MAG: exodeoxyribonuclease 7 small subunit [Gammaproteobacteria bacterium]|jgi:exodeoxyribonuclease VII small subunit|nr:exodeoxyribonuclease VII small subunit [SAR86 cluster bacterium]MCS5548441.1 exodeoxyribonuclease VII small subunit [SAR86 cluster bacterium]GIS75425.1 MAG: exodeoxyribonuclease 7 small subunit [Gammaproteobacteria bacterium]GIT61121.1 MAG: exodeoxyribonuclease 7 small subunit [Gammaproteobacteria bacterium]|tara:strand:+ start:149 stop:382 length:234 start_codon:yes stop_codon:yes gene_type:complete